MAFGLWDWIGAALKMLLNVQKIILRINISPDSDYHANYSPLSPSQEKVIILYFSFQQSTHTSSSEEIDPAMAETTATSNLKTVVVAVDSSEESMKALKWALDNLKLDTTTTSTSTLIILHVQPPPSLSSGINPGAIPFGGPNYSEVPAFAAAIEAHQKRISDAIINHALKICKEEKTEVNVKTEVIVGDAKEIICQVVEQVSADLLVMGSHSYGPIKRMFLGSVSNYCTNQAQCPVMVVKD